MTILMHNSAAFSTSRCQGKYPIPEVRLTNPKTYTGRSSKPLLTQLAASPQQVRWMFLWVYWHSESLSASLQSKVVSRLLGAPFSISDGA